MKQHKFKVEYNDDLEPKVFSRPYGFLEGNDPRNPDTGFRCIEEEILKVVDGV